MVARYTDFYSVPVPRPDHDPLRWVLGRTKLDPPPVSDTTQERLQVAADSTDPPVQRQILAAAHAAACDTDDPYAVLDAAERAAEQSRLDGDSPKDAAFAPQLVQAVLYPPVPERATVSVHWRPRRPWRTGTRDPFIVNLIFTAALIAGLLWPLLKHFLPAASAFFLGALLVPATLGATILLSSTRRAGTVLFYPGEGTHDAVVEQAARALAQEGVSLSFAYTDCVDSLPSRYGYLDPGETRVVHCTARLYDPRYTSTAYAGRPSGEGTLTLTQQGRHVQCVWQQGTELV